jgi:stearoyl-CoA desaturase (delta-9 desaturase)
MKFKFYESRVHSGHIFDRFQDLIHKIDWYHFTIISFTTFLTVYTIFNIHLCWYTFVWCVIYYFFTGLGVTAGYHRLFSHQSYEASPLLQLILLLAGSASLEGSALWWCRDHRAHHRYTDTDFPLRTTFKLRKL